MRRSSSWQSLRWVMAWTAYVALVSIAVRSVAGPVTSARTSLGWAAVTIAVASSLFLPVAGAISIVMLPGNVGGDRRCPRCSRPEIRQVRERGRGLFDPSELFRCGACWTPFDLAGGALVERPEPEPEPKPRGAGSAGIWYIEPAGPGASAAGIEFLEDVVAASRTSPGGPCPQVMPATSSPGDGPGVAGR